MTWYAEYDEAVGSMIETVMVMSTREICLYPVQQTSRLWTSREAWEGKGENSDETRHYWYNAVSLATCFERTRVDASVVAFRRSAAP